MLNRAIVMLKAFFRGLASEFRLVWLALLAVVFAFFVVFRSGGNEPYIRLYGLFLQLLGLGTVFHGIQKTRELFGHPSYTQLLLEKLKRIRWGRSIVIEPEPASLKVSAGDLLRVNIAENVGLTDQIQAQVTALIQSVERMMQRLDQMQDKIDADLREHAESLQKEKQLREEKEKELRKLLEVAETGGLDISLFGLFLLILGLVLSTASIEIARWAKQLLTLCI